MKILLAGVLLLGQINITEPASTVTINELYNSPHECEDRVIDFLTMNVLEYGTIINENESPVSGPVTGGKLVCSDSETGYEYSSSKWQIYLHQD